MPPGKDVPGFLYTNTTVNNANQLELPKACVFVPLKVVIHTCWGYLGVAASVLVKIDRV